MPRVKRGKIALKRREKVLKYVKGFKWGRKSKERLANEALLHAYTHSFSDRKKKKRNFRRLWNIKINAACRQNNLSYSAFINQLKQKNNKLDRKILATLAEHYPLIFKQIISL